MSNNNGNNGSGNGRFHDGEREWEHPRNPRIRVTNDRDHFLKLVRMDAHDGVILVRPDELREAVGGRMKEAFARVHDMTKPPNTFTAQVTYDAAERFLDVKGLIAPPLQSVQGEMEYLLEVFAQSVSPRSTLYIAEDTANLFPSKNRAVPVMMTHWVTAGGGAMTPEQNLLLQPGHIGFFTPDVALPLHGYKKSNSSVTFAAIPTRG